MAMPLPSDDYTDKKSVTLRRSLISEVEDLAGRRGFSAATDEALAQWVARTRLRRAIEEYERTAGVITPDEMEAIVRRVGGL
ncbi:hypothetical protein ACFVMC_31465 [Nocardia sp. NPDC127579]|uniref:hypothetical protein n=1 Tax=Nocardia sp. NPDC127579 TaxID=3345402 RepID=UPI0036255CFA